MAHNVDLEDTTDPTSWIKLYLDYRTGRENLERVEGDAKKRLMVWLNDNGELDDKGSRTFTLPVPVGDVLAIKRERRVSQSLNEDAAFDLIKKYDLSDSCLEIVYVVNEDALLAANFAGKIPDDEIAALYSEKESFAFVLSRDKKKRL